MLSHKILVVDDEPFILRSLLFILKKEGYEALSATDGEEALAKIAAERPEIVFLDVMMPKKDGYEVCRSIKADPALAGTHVILLTARGQARDREKGVDVGADEYITKPFSPSMLVEKVRSIIAARIG
jgi:DNA-binding response OmpR family regulator